MRGPHDQVHLGAAHPESYNHRVDEESSYIVRIAPPHSAAPNFHVTTFSEPRVAFGAYSSHADSSRFDYGTPQHRKIFDAKTLFSSQTESIVRASGTRSPAARKTVPPPQPRIPSLPPTQIDSERREIMHAAPDGNSRPSEPEQLIERTQHTSLFED
jgi:hypothetical protein